MASPRTSCAPRPRRRSLAEALPPDDDGIVREHGQSKGRYVLRENGAEAELTYSILSPTMIIADHTGVPDEMRGSGAGLRLVKRLVADARAEGVTIVPLCPFVKSQYRRHPEWADVFQG
ncbi:N-acetyltransferase [Rhodobacterales bacterium HKCCE3408]|nr:N-acetyltransferase [Rhodobacterales bacterium HKCCE3408]